MGPQSRLSLSGSWDCFFRVRERYLYYQEDRDRSYYLQNYRLVAFSSYAHVLCMLVLDLIKLSLPLLYRGDVS